MLLGHPVTVGAGLWVVGEVNPAKLLKGRFKGRIVPEAINRLISRLIIGKRNAIAQWNEIGAPWTFDFYRESDEIGFWIIDIHPDEAHPLAAPQLHTQSVLLILIHENTHWSSHLQNCRSNVDGIDG